MQLFTDNQNSVISDTVIGTYLHGIFDNTGFTRAFLNNIRGRKGLNPINQKVDLDALRDKELDKLAAHVRKHLDMKKIYEILENNEQIKHK